MTFPIGKVQLIYSKSKVYVHPSKNSKDNISGFIYIYKDSITSSNKDFRIGWIPELLITDSNDLNSFNKLDLNNDEENVFINKPSSLGYFSFVLHIHDLFSIQTRSPSLGWWYGSIIINSKNPTLDQLPVLFFHDDECKSFQIEQTRKNKEFEPFNEIDNELFWGGLQFIGKLGEYCNLVKSSLESSVYLINPTQNDLNNFSPTNVVEEEKPIVIGEKIGKLVDTARWKVLETLAKVTNFTQKHVEELINNDQAPVVLKKFLNNPQVLQINQDFDLAKVYLAKWAIGVQEEAEKNRQRIILDSQSRDLLSKELGLNFDKLLPEEIANAHERFRQLNKQEWDTYFDYTGHLNITVNEVKNRIFHGGVSDDIRKEVWLFLLQVYPWDSSKQERESLYKIYKEQYEELKSQWEVDTPSDDYFKDQKFRIEKDVQRTDRNLPIFAKVEGEDDDDGDDNHDVSVMKNPNLAQLREILLTFNQLNDKLGYVQGMTDLLSPLYVKIQDPVLTFWSFVKFMDRMERNFLHDQSGIKDQMNALNELVQFMLPDLFIHLEKCESSNLFFFFRMLLVWFKREFPFEEVCSIWENFWTDYYSSQYQLFFALAILQKNEKVIINHLDRFDQVLKFFNDLSMTYKLNDLLTRSELLFLKFKKMVEIIDRSEEGDEDDKKSISDNLRTLLSKKIVIQKELERHDG